MGALGFIAFGVKIERVFLDDEAALLGDLLLAALDFLVDKFFDAATIDAYQMVVMFPRLDLEDRFA